MLDYWAKPGWDRQQAMLFYPTLDQSISDGHPVRLLDEILRVLDWSAWEEEYDGRRGQPPIPPWVMAGVILYGLTRSSNYCRLPSPPPCRDFPMAESSPMCTLLPKVPR